MAVLTFSINKQGGHTPELGVKWIAHLELEPFRNCYTFINIQDLPPVQFLEKEWVEPTVYVVYNNGTVTVSWLLQELTTWASELLQSQGKQLQYDLRKAISDGFTLPAIIEIVCKLYKTHTLTVFGALLPKF